MPLTTSTDPDTVLGLTNAVVAADPVGHTVFGSIAFGVQEDDAAAWAAHPAASPLVLAARSQPYTPVTFTAGWTDLAEVTAALRALDPPPAALAGPAPIVEDVGRKLGRPITGRSAERLFRLDELIPPAAVAGAARVADAADADVLADWYTAFTIEAFGHVPPGFDARTMVERGVLRSRCWVWSDADGVGRAMAVRHPAVAGVSRVGPVYTVPSARGEGFGSAVTAAATRDILADGDVACLYTDLANPTSNKIYAALGYRPVLDRTLLQFE